MSKDLKELAEQISAQLHGDGSLQVSGCAGLEDAQSDQVSFVVNRKYVKFLARSQAGAIIMGPEHVEAASGRNLLVADDPYFAFRQALVALHGFRKHPTGGSRGTGGVSDLAIIDPSAQIGQECTIEPMVFIAAGARIGCRCVIYPHCWIGPDTVLGDECVLFPNVTIYDHCLLGNCVTLHAGCVIGQDGFGYATHQGVHHKIPQVGNVVIEDDVELGANCAVDRATVGSTVIARGSKLSDLVAIGHGTKIGPHNLLVAQVGVAGSATTGSYVVMGGQVGVAGHLHIGDMAQLAAKTGVMADIPARTQVGGQPALPLTQTKRNVLALARLPRLIQQFKNLVKRVDQLEDKT